MSSAYSSFVLQSAREKLSSISSAERHSPRNVGELTTELETSLASIKWEYTIRPGFWMSIMDYCSQQPTVICYAKNEPMINFGYTISGQLVNKVRSPGQAAVDYHNRAGCGGILYQPQRAGEIHLLPEQHVKVLHLHICPAVFYQLFAEELEYIPKSLDRALEAERHNFCFRGGMPQAIQGIIFRLLGGCAPGMPCHLFYESLALELIACQIAEVNRHAADGFCFRLSGAEREQVFAAAELLIRDLQSPPSLRELSLAAGLNVNKLQQGFQHLYGLSVYRYLNHFRMERAQLLFSKTDMNVSEVAFAVGYSNISHFGTAFRKFTGVLPKRFLKEIGR